MQIHTEQMGNYKTFPKFNNSFRNLQNNSRGNEISFKQKYRVILTKACPRHCPDCVNTVDGVLEQAKRMNLADIFANGDDIVLTGGEPGIYPRLIEDINTLKKNNPLSKLFIYASVVTKKLLNAMEKVDGVSFTLHYPLTESDKKGFYLFQDKIKQIKSQTPNKTYRLYSDSRIKEKELNIEDNLYARHNRIKWMNAQEILSQKDRNFGCPVDEQLVLLKDC